ncbi:MAG: type IV pilus biogenesis protein EbsA [Cyanophyceae cyanobacterium]
MTAINELQPAKPGDTSIYLPYYSKDKHNLLPYAISLYKQGSLEGQRRIEGGEDIPFVATWYISTLPSELTRCRIQFDGQAELSYEATILNAEFIDYLISIVKKFQRSRLTDFPRAFYRKLLRFDEGV